MKLRAVGVDIFAGGFTLGVERHFDVLAHLEHGPYGVATFKLNRPYVPVHYPPARWPLSSLAGGVDLMYCNPPCAIVSVAGRSLKNGRDSWRTDPRTSCIRDCVTAALRVRPRVLAIESVTQLYTVARELVNEQVARLLEVGYGVTHLLVNGAYLGASQLRKRYFLVAHLGDLRFERLNYAPPDTLDEVLARVADPGYVPPVKAAVLDVASRMKPGEGLRWVWERENPPETWTRAGFGVVGRPRMMEFRLEGDRPPGVFYGDFFWHPRENRRLGLEEAKALCGFPADYRFAVPAAAFSELARGVMPPVGDWLARQVAASLTGAGGGDLKRGAGHVNVHDIRKPPQELHP